jgi:S-adenosylmethionine:tRNA ribosyltransferase-isomerase
MKTSDFDFYLPQELIAQEPNFKRDASRMLVLNRDDAKVEHKCFCQIKDYLKPGDLLVLNHTKVIPARLLGIKNTGAKIELVLLKRLDCNCWECLVRPGKKLKPGTSVVFGDGKLMGDIIDYTRGGGRIVKFHYKGTFEEVLEELGQMPLPPYIRKELKQKDRYQTVYARKSGSVAAPTAGLHFTNGLINQLKLQEINVTFLTLHVGLGTFRPVKEDIVENHLMHSEYYEISEETVRIINHTKASGNKVIAVGTTTVRALETIASKQEKPQPQSGWTDIFIYPGYQFRLVDCMLTNFHLPRSSLLMLVAAFAGLDLVKKAYSEAIVNRYRFYSFGDAMLVL